MYFVLNYYLTLYRIKTQKMEINSDLDLEIFAEIQTQIYWDNLNSALVYTDGNMLLALHLLYE